MTETKKRKKPSEGAMAPVDVLGEQQLDETQQELVKEAYARLEAWEKDCQVYHASATKCRQVYRLNDPEQDLPGTPPARKAIQLQTLKSTINNCVADLIKSMKLLTLFSRIRQKPPRNPDPQPPSLRPHPPRRC